MDPAVIIRPAAPEDFPAVRAVHVDAFGRQEEADILAQLRKDGDALVELVAVKDDEILAHIMFSRMRSDGGFFAALGPLAVRSAHQGQGYGDVLCRAGIEACRAAGVRALVVLGHPDYYPRFGFSHAATKRFAGEYDRLAYMAMELQPGGLDEGGRVRYAPAFDV